MRDSTVMENSNGDFISGETVQTLIHSRIIDRRDIRRYARPVRVRGKVGDVFMATEYVDLLAFPKPQGRSR